MPRATREKTKYPGIYKRAIHDSRQTVYDVKIKNRWLSKGKHTRIEDAKATTSGTSLSRASAARACRRRSPSSWSVTVTSGRTEGTRTRSPARRA